MNTSFGFEITFLSLFRQITSTVIIYILFRLQPSGSKAKFNWRIKNLEGGEHLFEQTLSKK
jgi:hypothetical protein